LPYRRSRLPDASDSQAPLGRIIIPNDETVPEPQHLNPEFGDSLLQTQYPPHTRIVSHARANVCLLGYALSLPGAKRLLSELSVFDHEVPPKPIDLGLRSLCDGTNGRRQAICLSAQPQLFQHYRGQGSKTAWSDINPEIFHGGNEKEFTRNVRWSTRVNMQKLVNGETDYVDLFEDGEEGVNTAE
jgi:hypothetical protein